MGFFGNMLSGGAGIAGANNAHLAELAIQKLSQADKKRLAMRIVDITIASGFQNMTNDQVFGMFNSKERISQLNLIALACAELGIQPPAAGESWMSVRNPFLLATDAKDLETNAGHFRRKHGLSVKVGTAPIDIKLWA